MIILIPLAALLLLGLVAACWPRRYNRFDDRHYYRGETTLEEDERGWQEYYRRGGR